MNRGAKKHMLHVTGYAIRGGCETCCSVFVGNSPEFEHTVLVLGESGPMTEIWRRLGARVVHLDALGLGWIRFFERMRTELVHLAPFDTVILWARIRAPLMLAVLARYKRPVVLHAGNPFNERWRVRQLLRACAFLPRPRSTIIVGCSVHVARSFRRAPYYRRFPVESCLNPVTSNPSNPHRPRILTPGDQVRLGMVARLDPIKDHGMLLRTFAFLRADWPGAELHLAGDGSLRSSLEALAGELGIASAVHFHGSVEGVAGFLGMLDLFCYFTTTREGMGNALAEALTFGLPCVVSDLPVMHEVAGEPGDGVVLFTKPDPRAGALAMSGLLGDVGARETLSARAFLRGNTWFAPRRVVERYLALMETKS
jgi:glycosyltransferase involved in cell wall biosynthesis